MTVRHPARRGDVGLSASAAATITSDWTFSGTLTIPAATVTAHEAAIDHDALKNFTQLEHFTQAEISITTSQISDFAETEAGLKNIVEDTTPELGATVDALGFGLFNVGGLRQRAHISSPLPVAAGEATFWVMDAATDTISQSPQFTDEVDVTSRLAQAQKAELITGAWQFEDQVEVFNTGSGGIRIKMNGASAEWFTTDTSAVNIDIFQKVNVNGALDTYYNGVKRAATSASGVFRILADGDTETETNRLELNNSQLGVKAEIGFDVNDGSKLLLQNQIHGGPVELSGEDDGGSFKAILLGDPDGATTIYYAGVATIATATDGIDITGDLGGTTIGGITEALLLDKSAVEIITGLYSFNGASARIRFEETGATTDEGNWELRANADAFTLRTMADDYNTSEVILTVARTDIQVTNVTIDSDLFTVTAPMVATSYGGITEANLLDKAADETISKTYKYTDSIPIIIEHAQPKFFFAETGAASDEGNWLYRINGGLWGVYSASDAAPQTIVNPAITANRVGLTFNKVTITPPLIAVTYFQVGLITSAALDAVGNAVNTDAGKVQGSMLYNTDTDNPVYAAGNAAADIWVDGAGATAHSPSA